MDYKVVDVPLKKIKTIHHLSDIHVRNLKRHTEYRQVFDKVYDRIKQNSKDSNWIDYVDKNTGLPL